MIEEKIHHLVEEYFNSPKENEEVNVPLMRPSYGSEEVNAAISVLLSMNVTMGENVFKFEEKFADYIGVKYAVMVNSGSSANLLAMSVLAEERDLGGNFKKRIKHEVITAPVTWSTTVFPIVQISAIPVFVDVKEDTYLINETQLDQAHNIKTEAVLPVHLLGNPCNMKAITEWANDWDCFIIEDACEALGAKYDNKMVGSFGDFGTFSFFFAHHITTIEGGMVVTNNEEYAEMARVMRAHGWIRDLKNKERIAKNYEIDSKYLFLKTGFNVRPTEISGAFGLHQLDKIDSFIHQRRLNARIWSDGLSEFEDYLILPREQPNTYHSWFCYPITVKQDAPFSKQELTDFLKEKKIETRPIVAGNILEQPVMKNIEHRIAGNLQNAENIMKNAFYFGNHQNINENERMYVIDCVKEFMRKKL